MEEGDFWTIGRDPDECQFVLEDPLVSADICCSVVPLKGITIENLSETNPAQLNDEDISDHPHLLTMAIRSKLATKLSAIMKMSQPILEEEAAL